jgi:nicotinamidase-related amidase
MPFDRLSVQEHSAIDASSKMQCEWTHPMEDDFLPRPELRRVWKRRPALQLASLETALVVLDVQQLTCDPQLGLRASLHARGYVDFADYYSVALAVALGNIVRLVEQARRSNFRVVFTRLESNTLDGRDVPRVMRRNGLWSAKGSPESKFVPQISPADYDLVLSRSTMSFFGSWLGDQLLKNLGVTTLVLTGVLTEGSVASTARDAGDRGYSTLVVGDACATLGPDEHKFALEAIALWYCRIGDTRSVIAAMTSDRGYL